MKRREPKISKRDMKDEAEKEMFEESKEISEEERPKKDKRQRKRAEAIVIFLKERVFSSGFKNNDPREKMRKRTRKVVAKISINRRKLRIEKKSRFW